ncbi:hypothetical protein [Salibacterium halotolerans]|uniref:Uncharacterized protein n=1 Tax=Salibacterium halotolerans TaxID=1884432 RepID=A0A1I5SEQ6_9BACI|nr:hypothetical protein [Salibacterium halotolerans]SFP69224.1 hypothetical protein SAMN05518683_108154 [Salibacterium halotolerans]
MRITVVLVVMALVYEALGRMIIGKERRKIKDTTGKKVYLIGISIMAAGGLCDYFHCPAI